LSEKHGVERIETAGADFDPNFHEALMQVESDRHEDNKIVNEIEKGYLLNGRLIRPSRVCVCKKTKKENNDVCEKMRIWKNKEEETWEKLLELI